MTTTLLEFLTWMPGPNRLSPPMSLPPRRPRQTFPEMRALHQDARRLSSSSVFGSSAMVGSSVIPGVVALADVVDDREAVVGRPSFRPAAGGDAPAAQLRCLAFLAAVALRDAVAHVPVVREPEHDPVAPVLDRLGGRDHDVAAGVGHDSVPAAFEPRLDAGAVDLAKRDAELAAVLDDAVADDDAVVAPLVAAAANADPLAVAVADAARVDDELDGPPAASATIPAGTSFGLAQSGGSLSGSFERSIVSRGTRPGPT